MEDLRISVNCFGPRYGNSACHNPSLGSVTSRYKELFPVSNQDCSNGPVRVLVENGQRLRFPKVIPAGEAKSGALKHRALPDRY